MTIWTPNAVQMLKDLWRDKTSARTIAAVLNTKALPKDARREFTRNAVIGKINRLGLQGEGGLASKFTKSKKRKPRATPSPPTVVTAKEHTPTDKILDALGLLLGEESTGDRLVVEPAVWPTIEEEVKIAVSDRVTLFHLGPGVCKWPIGDPLAADFTFCGGGCDVTQSYCAYHRLVAYRPDTNPKRAAQKAYR